MTKWQEVKLGDVCLFIDYRGKTPHKIKSGIPLITAKIVKNGRIYDPTEFISEEEYQSRMTRGMPKCGDILITTEAPLGEIAELKDEHVAIGQRLITMRGYKDILHNKYLKYYLQSKEGQSKLKARETGTTVTGIKSAELKQVLIPLPPLETQKKIAGVLSALDNKIELNQRENNNLEQQAFAIFNSMFDFCAEKNKIIGDYITPKRGKNLLSKNAVYGDVPVVAGGLNPATYHNVANTSAPVITISASGANAGYINLWHIPVWSSDSSYIDESLTASVYFWYVLLKQRQKEIFDSQTGSAQPHIYPQHIANLPISNINEDDMDLYNNNVSALFKKIGLNIKENQRLIQLRDALLPKLMSGEIDVSNVNISTDKLSFTED